MTIDVKMDLEPAELTDLQIRQLRVVEGLLNKAYRESGEEEVYLVAVIKPLETDP